MSRKKVPPFRMVVVSRLLLLLFAGLVWGCSSSPSGKAVKKAPEKMEVRVSRDLRKLLDFALENKGRINDTIKLERDSLTAALYSLNNYRPFWSRDKAWVPAADSLYHYIVNCERAGLFPLDYHYRAIAGHRAGLLDSASREDPSQWSRADLIMTDAFMMLARHLKYGRLDRDSITLRKDTLLPVSYYDSILTMARIGYRLPRVLASLEPKIPLYDSLKSALSNFIDSVAPFRRYTHIDYPFTDSVEFLWQLQHRLFEEDILLSPSDTLDKKQWKEAIKDYQTKAGLKPTGRINSALIECLNKTNWEKFLQVCINLDRYKQLMNDMPETYLWVNVPGYYLELWDDDTVVFRSKIVVGKPLTRTPLLSGSISNMVTYPQWSIPTSIVAKEIIPGMRKDTNYLAKRGYMLINGHGQEIDPSTINWWRYKKGLPYRVIQGSGDDNALGIMKFNFINKYSVYLHDTNQRYLFARSERALSHGCVRVQQWKKLAFYLLNKDSISATREFNTTDSVRAWLKRKEKHWVPVRNRLPLFIRYITVDGINGRLKFYDDVYGEDSLMQERYFAYRPVQ